MTYWRKLLATFPELEERVIASSRRFETVTGWTYMARAENLGFSVACESAAVKAVIRVRAADEFRVVRGDEYVIHYDPVRHLRMAAATLNEDFADTL